MGNTLLLRIWNKPSIDKAARVSCLYRDFELTKSDLEAIISWSQQRISDILAMTPQGAKKEE